MKHKALKSETYISDSGIIEDSDFIGNVFLFYSTICMVVLLVVGGLALFN